MNENEEDARTQALSQLTDEEKVLFGFDGVEGGIPEGRYELLLMQKIIDQIGSDMVMFVYHSIEGGSLSEFTDKAKERALAKLTEEQKRILRIK